ncbi:MAG: DctP family TRAP transporter solute-binding subunit [Tindallia sp. MSAO_Bac2]|nr:MAG: DctP family TRAP transporter solute-binding subunit [Tindallia sp. MSAO_Bac2]
MKKFMSMIIVLSLLLILPGCSGSNGSDNSAANRGQEEFELGITYVVAETQSTHLAAEVFKEKVEERTDGRVSIELYPAGSLYASEFDASEAVQLGNIEMTITATSPLAGFIDEFMVIDLPYLFSDAESAYEALDGDLGDQLLGLLPPLGLKGLSFGETGFRQITNNRGPIESPDDLSGLRIRTMETPAHIRPFQEWGANPSPLAFGELYTALQQGTYDAMEAPVSLIYSSRLHEVQDYLTVSNHFYTATIMLINDDLFNEMPADIQEIIQEEALAFKDLQRELASEQEAEWFEAIQEDGIQVNELSDDQRNVFQEIGLTLYDEFEDEIGRDLIDLAIEISEN